ncbi:MAG: primosomal protein N' [Pirellulaceae bacterium]|nr:primosomal protein N' [Pirellulaceae bacterium]
MNGHQPQLFPQDVPPWELDAQATSTVARIVFAEAPHGPLDYLVPADMADQALPGVRVKVPLGKSNREMLGYCIDIQQVQQSPEAFKAISEVLDPEPLCTGKLLELMQWMSRYYLAPLGQVFEAAVPASVRASAGSRQRVMLYPTTKAHDTEQLAKLSTKQQQIVRALIAEGKPLTSDQLRAAAKCSAAPIALLRTAEFIEARSERILDDLSARIPAPQTAPLALSVDQRQALREILDALETKKQQTILLHGITGSGKTEVYMQAIHEVLSFGRGAIVLVPEISLTPQTRHRFMERFGQVACLHSHMSPVERHHQWRRIAAGEAPVVIGPRSAIFAPLPRLGLIVLDEEHDSSFKQDSQPRYHARDVALHRSYLEQIPVVLGSATPSLESWQRARTGVYRLASLPRRIHNRPLPEVTTIDLRLQHTEPNRGAISRPLHKAITETLSDKGQVILLLNRRGFATTIQCPSCGHVVACPDCDLPLTHHRDGAKAVCHYCDYQIPTPPVCPSCKFDGIHYGGLGTQRLEVEVQQRFPQASVARMDSDTMRRPGSHERVLGQFRKGELQILLGTQMIAKGLDFPNVLLVGVINADSALHFPDFRASERTFQLVTQVAGRTGRGEKAGRVLVQTYSPEHPAIIAAGKHDFLNFAAEELKKREHFGYPPYGYLARIIMRGPELTATEGFAESFAAKLQTTRTLQGIDARMLGPAPPPLAKLRGKFRFHIMIHTLEPEPLNRLLVRTLVDIKPPKDIQYVIDIDPIDTL